MGKGPETLGEKNTYIQAGRQAGRHAGKQASKQAGRQKGRQTNIQAYRQTDRQTDRQPPNGIFFSSMHVLLCMSCLRTKYCPQKLSTLIDVRIHEMSSSLADFNWFPKSLPLQLAHTTTLSPTSRLGFFLPCLNFSNQPVSCNLLL